MQDLWIAAANGDRDPISLGGAGLASCFHHLGKGFWIQEGQAGQHFAVQLDIAFFEAVDDSL
jgi:hypothetical protein